MTTLTMGKMLAAIQRVEASQPFIVCHTDDVGDVLANLYEVLGIPFVTVKTSDFIVPGVVYVVDPAYPRKRDCHA